MLIFHKNFLHMISLGFFAAAGFRLLPLVNRVMGNSFIKFYHPTIKIISSEFDKAKKLENKKKIISNKLHGEFNNITLKMYHLILIQ